MFACLLQNISGKEPLEKVIKLSGGKKAKNFYIADFYLHMTHHCVIGDSTILLVLQLDSEINQPDNILVVGRCVML